MKFKTEQEFHKFFYEQLKEDFYTVHEVPGVCLVNHPSLESVNVRADFLLFPRSHLVERGFAETWFAAELKLGKIEHAYRQAFWYTLSEFTVKNRKIVPAFAVGCTPEDAKRALQRERFDSGISQAFGELNVGRMHVGVPGYAHWVVMFYAGMAYSRRYLEGRFDSSDPYMVRQNFKSFKLKVGSNPVHSVHDAGRETA